MIGGMSPRIECPVTQIEVYFTGIHSFVVYEVQRLAMRGVKWYATLPVRIGTMSKDFIRFRKIMKFAIKIIKNN